MPDPEKVALVVGEWVEKAENDLTNAVHTLTIKKRCPTDTVCFHAQQCVEKYLKAILVQNGIDFPKTHDIEKIITSLPQGISIPLTADEQGRFTEYATIARYPGGGNIPVSEARKAVAAARRVRKASRSLLESISQQKFFS
jgi:HEPN domain-containing protein